LHQKIGNSPLPVRDETVIKTHLARDDS
jgi:hypothetical protein